MRFNRIFWPALVSPCRFIHAPVMSEYITETQPNAAAGLVDVALNEFIDRVKPGTFTAAQLADIRKLFEITIGQAVRTFTGARAMDWHVLHHAHCAVEVFRRMRAGHVQHTLAISVTIVDALTPAIRYSLKSIVRRNAH
jgi:hypothetical protein